MTIRLTKLSNAEYALRDIREATMGDGTLKGASPAGYYTAPGNPPGRWIGSACRLVGGREGGEATSAQVRGLINERRDPASGRLLGDPRMEAGDQGNAPVAGWDLTATVPKSVSIMWAFADPDTRQAIDRCLDQAARMTIAYLEDEYARTRAGRGGVASVACDGLAGFQFDHWDSRDGDPHPHKHIVISNRVRRGTDGQWTALDGRLVYQSTLEVSEYHANLVRDLITRELGWSWEARQDGETPYGRSRACRDDSSTCSPAATPRSVAKSSAASPLKRHGPDDPSSTGAATRSTATYGWRPGAPNPRGSHPWRTSDACGPTRRTGTRPTSASPT